MALPIWAEYMKKLYNNPNIEISKGGFKYPEGGVSVPLDCDKINELELEEEF